MICPSCGAEYRDGFKECNDCGITLIEKFKENPPEKEKPVETEVVFETGNHVLLSLAKAILDGAGILYIIRNEASSNFLGIGSFGAGFNPLSGAMIIETDKRRAEEAKILLSTLEEGGNTEDWEWEDDS